MVDHRIPSETSSIRYPSKALAQNGPSITVTDLPLIKENRTAMFNIKRLGNRHWCEALLNYMTKGVDI